MASNGVSTYFRQAVPLLVDLHATVLTSWRDPDDYNTGEDYCTMTLRVQTWSSKSELKARIRSTDALDSNVLYSIKGRMYLGPGKEWTDTYLRIDSAQKFYGPGTIRSDKKPTFEVVADIQAVRDTHIVISWFTYDGYQMARYHQNAVVNLARRIPRSHTFVNVMARITGTMNGPDYKKQWQCTCIEPEVLAPPSSSEYLDTVIHGLNTMHTLTQMTQQCTLPPLETALP